MNREKKYHNNNDATDSTEWAENGNNIFLIDNVTIETYSTESESS